MPITAKQINVVQQSLSTNTVSANPTSQSSPSLLPISIFNVNDQPQSSSPRWIVNDGASFSLERTSPESQHSIQSSSSDTSLAEYQNMVELISQNVETGMRQSMLPRFFYLRAFNARLKERMEDYQCGLLLIGDRVPEGAKLTAEFWDQRSSAAYNRHSQKGENINEKPSPEPSLEDLYHTQRAMDQASARFASDSPLRLLPPLSGPSGPVTKKQLAIYSLAISGGLNFGRADPPSWTRSIRRDVVEKPHDLTSDFTKNPSSNSIAPEMPSNITRNQPSKINLLTRQKRSPQEKKIDDDSDALALVKVADSGMSPEDLRKHFGPHDPLPLHATEVLHRHFPLVKLTEKHKIAAVVEECSLGRLLTDTSPILGIEGAVENLGKQIEEAVRSKKWTDLQKIQFRIRTLDEFKAKYLYLTNAEKFWFGFKIGFAGGIPAVMLLTSLEKDALRSKEMATLSVADIEALKAAAEAWQIAMSLVPGVAAISALLDLADAIKEGKKDICRYLSDIVIAGSIATGLSEGGFVEEGKRLTFEELEGRNLLSAESKALIESKIAMLDKQAKEQASKHVALLLDQAEQKVFQRHILLDDEGKTFVVFDGLGDRDGVYFVQNVDGKLRLQALDGGFILLDEFEYSPDGTHLFKEGMGSEQDFVELKKLEKALKEMIERDEEKKINKQQFGEGEYLEITDDEKNVAEMLELMLKQEHKRRLPTLVEDAKITFELAVLGYESIKKLEAERRWLQDDSKVKQQEIELRQDPEDPRRQKELIDLKHKLEKSQEKYLEVINKWSEARKELKKAKSAKKAYQHQQHHQIVSRLKQAAKEKAQRKIQQRSDGKGQQGPLGKSGYSTVTDDGQGKKVTKNVDGKDHTYRLEKDHHGTTYRLKSDDPGAPKDFGQYVITDEGKLERGAITGGAEGDDGEVAGPSHGQQPPRSAPPLAQSLSEAQKASLREDPYFKALVEARKVREQITDLKAQIEKSRRELQAVKSDQKNLTPEKINRGEKKLLEAKEKQLVEEQLKLLKKRDRLFKEQKIATSHQESSAEKARDQEKNKQRKDTIALIKDAEKRVAEEIKQEFKNSLAKVKEAENKHKLDADAKRAAEISFSQNPSDVEAQQALSQAIHQAHVSQAQLTQAQSNMKAARGAYEAAMTSQGAPSMADLIQRQEEARELERGGFRPALASAPDPPPALPEEALFAPYIRQPDGSIPLPESGLPDVGGSEHFNIEYEAQKDAQQKSRAVNEKIKQRQVEGLKSKEKKLEEKILKLTGKKLEDRPKLERELADVKKALARQAQLKQEIPDLEAKAKKSQERATQLKVSYRRYGENVDTWLKDKSSTRGERISLGNRLSQHPVSPADLELKQRWEAQLRKAQQSYFASEDPEKLIKEKVREVTQEVQRKATIDLCAEAAGCPPPLLQQVVPEQVPDPQPVLELPADPEAMPDPLDLELPVEPDQPAPEAPAVELQPKIEPKPEPVGGGDALKREPEDSEDPLWADQNPIDIHPQLGSAPEPVMKGEPDDTPMDTGSFPEDGGGMLKEDPAPPEAPAVELPSKVEPKPEPVGGGDALKREPEYSEDPLWADQNPIDIHPQLGSAPEPVMKGEPNDTPMDTGSFPEDGGGMVKEDPAPLEPAVELPPKVEPKDEEVAVKEEPDDVPIGEAQQPDLAEKVDEVKQDPEFLPINDAELAEPSNRKRLHDSGPESPKIEELKKLVKGHKKSIKGMEKAKEEAEKELVDAEKQLTGSDLESKRAELKQKMEAIGRRLKVSQKTLQGCLQELKEARKAPEPLSENAEVEVELSEDEPLPPKRGRGKGRGKKP